MHTTTRKTTAQQAPTPTPDGAPPDAPRGLAMRQATRDAVLTEIAGMIDALSTAGEHVKHATLDEKAKPDAVLDATLGKIADMATATRARLKASGPGEAVGKARGPKPWPQDLSAEAKGRG